MEEGRRKAILDILRAAMRREVAAFNYYYKASRNAPFPETESLLVQLAEEERKHRTFIAKELHRIERLVAPESPENHLDENRVSYFIEEDVPLKRLPVIPGIDTAAVSLPAELLGGDYLDAIPLEREREAPALGVLLYDVMGHGLDATQVKAFCRKVAAQVGEAWLRGKSGVDLNHPAPVIETLNRRLQNECQDCGRFLSVFYGVLDPVGKELTYTSAGHEPPILVRSSGEYVPLTDTDLLLGVELEADYHAVSIPLDTGDTIVLYSDGMTEAFNSDDVMFDRSGLLEVVRQSRGLCAEAILRRALAALRDFLGGRRIADELSLLVIKVGEQRAQVDTR